MKLIVDAGTDRTANRLSSVMLRDDANPYRRRTALSVRSLSFPVARCHRRDLCVHTALSHPPSETTDRFQPDARRVSLFSWRASNPDSRPRCMSPGRSRWATPSSTTLSDPALWPLARHERRPDWVACRRAFGAGRKARHAVGNQMSIGSEKVPIRLIARGTESSNPLPSSGESCANPTSSIRAHWVRSIREYDLYTPTCCSSCRGPY